MEAAGAAKVNYRLPIGLYWASPAGGGGISFAGVVCAARWLKPPARGNPYKRQHVYKRSSRERLHRGAGPLIPRHHRCDGINPFAVCMLS